MNEIEKIKEIEEFASEVIAQKNKKITDEVFLLIQNDKELMHKYLKLVAKMGDLGLVNRTIGKLVKTEYGLKNDTQRCTDPASTLIMSHQEFE